jgi:prefoldin beta subunit
LQDVIASRQKLEAQKQENLGVQKVGISLSSWSFTLFDSANSVSMQELAKLKNGETIYKLIGPVLLKQDSSEAESTVNGRIDFIGKEMYVVF